MNGEMQVVGISEYSGQTTVHPLGLAFVLILGLCILFLPRRWSGLPLLVMACFVSSAQRIVIAGADFDFLRIMVLFGVIRLILRKEYRCFVWRPLDTSMVLWTISSMVFNVLQLGTISTIMNRFGFAFDVFGMYFLFRCLVQGWQDVDINIKGALLISLPLAVLFLLENRTGRNLFSIFGGVPEITAVREGRLRCQGAFSHPILAGCFWASLIPLFAAYWWKSSKYRTWVITGIITSTIIVLCSASSTPVMGVFSAIIGGLFFYFRYQMRLVRWCILLTLITLHMVMNAPVWHLICRVSAVGGSTGWHRYNLIDQAINHFDEWWFSGCSGYAVASWGIHAGDVTNQYILEGVRAGFLTMCTFVAIIVIAFRELGRLGRLQKRNPYQLALSWALGVSLFVHCTNFVGVAYFGQIWILWYLLLAMIGSLSVQTASLTIQAIHPSVSVQQKSHLQNQLTCRVLYGG